ncbi:MAG: NAD(P)H-hydrate dehydratase, partial [Thermodesulfobacteriota bacterium]
GHLMAVAGAAGTTGAAAMTAMSALRSGAGLVTLGVPETVNAAVEPQVTEAMTRPLADTGAGVLSDAGAEEILDLLSGKDCLALGPGMGTAEQTRKLVEKLVRQSPVPVVVDADGINNLAENPEILKNSKSEVVLTPHPGEMARLTATSAKKIQQDRIGAARAFAETYGVYLVLKGARTVIAHPDGRIDINPTGNPGMASGGMGDVLTGMIAGWICQGYAPAEAAALSVYLHGAAADILAERRGPHGYLATDVMAFLPDALKAVITGEFVDITAGLTPQI